MANSAHESISYTAWITTVQFLDEFRVSEHWWLTIDSLTAHARHSLADMC
jgi:hypothetical protein